MDVPWWGYVMAAICLPFWGWVAVSVIRLNLQVAVIVQRLDGMDDRCDARSEIYPKLDAKLDALREAVSELGQQTARVFGILNGRTPRG